MQPPAQPVLDADEGLPPAGLRQGAQDQRKALEGIIARGDAGAVELDREQVVVEPVVAGADDRVRLGQRGRLRRRDGLGQHLVGDRRAQRGGLADPRAPRDRARGPVLPGGAQLGGELVDGGPGGRVELEGGAAVGRDGGGAAGLVRGFHATMLAKTHVKAQ